MLSVRFENKEVKLQESPLPETAAGVLVRVRACGICGSDLTILDSGFPIAGIPGHEIGGELEDGTTVAIEPIVPCGDCAPCQDGDYQVCRPGNGTIYGIARDGGMAEFIRVPERCLVRLPTGVDPRDACLVEPLAVAVHGVRRAGLAAEHRALIIGGGPIGLATAIAAASTGANVELIARHDAQIRAAGALGTELTSPEAASGADYDVVFDCAGSETAAEQACNAVRPRGLILLLAPGWDKLVLPAMPLAAKELELRVSMMYGRKGNERDVDRAAKLLVANPGLSETLVSHRFSLGDAPSAFQKARERSQGALKVVLEP